MPLIDFDHVNVRTANLGGMLEFYARALGMEAGPRPPFPFGGAWLYCGGRAVVHLVEVAEAPDVTGMRIEHYAFRGGDLAKFLRKLREQKIAYEISIVPGLGLQQVNLFDPDGNHLHIDFAPGEKAD
jgi:catechol 2,3-dioxygenase-like lactoylglutathione lyase family enzyme